MIAKPKSNAMSDFGTTSGGIFGDIVKYALENNFRGVDRVLSFDPAQINAQQEGSGVTALMAASGRGLDRMVAHLLSKADIDTALTDNFGKDALLHARPFPMIVRRIMEHRNPGIAWSEPNIRPV
tara:strand:+ start:256 stop:630 length:375 start_codon:yes stop_codon:yes gene_type:complete